MKGRQGSVKRRNQCKLVPLFYASSIKELLIKSYRYFSWDAKPIYEQIKDGMRHLVISNALTADEKLPSVRELAATLAINPNTIQRAYRDLEKEGYVYTISGKGTFVAAQKHVKDARTVELKGHFDEIVSELLYLAVEPEQLKHRITELEGEEDIHDTGK